jgi:hypothetical protein
MSIWDQANKREKLGLVWRNGKKISHLINDYLYLAFFLLIILLFIHIGLPCAATLKLASI